MVYVEFLRVRRTMIWFAGILAAILILIVTLSHNEHFVLNRPDSGIHGMAVPLGALAPIAMFFAAIYATAVGTSLNRESEMRDISWTKPISRTLLALQYILTDIAGIALYFVLAMAAILAVMLRFHLAPFVDESLLVEGLLAFGGAVMWYALIQMLTFGFPKGARALAGILWPIAFVAIGLQKIGGPVGEIARAVDVINPLAYMSSFTEDKTGNMHQTALWQLPADTRALCVWLLATLFCAIAIAFWPRREA